MLLLFANLPTATILSGANVLSVLAEDVAGTWLRILIVIDAVLVLGGGVLTGFYTVCGLVDRLTRYQSPLPYSFLVNSLQGSSPPVLVPLEVTIEWQPCHGTITGARIIYSFVCIFGIVVDNHICRVFCRLPICNDIGKCLPRA